MKKSYAATMVALALAVSGQAMALPSEIFVRMLDGNWKSAEGEYDFSDVEVDNDIAEFSFEREKKLGRFGHGSWDRREGTTVKCRGTGMYDPDSKLVHLQEVCPSHRRDANVVALITLKLEFDRNYRGGKLQLDGKRKENSVSLNRRGEVEYGFTTSKDETLVRERERQGGPRHRRGGPGGGGPGHNHDDKDDSGPGRDNNGPGRDNNGPGRDNDGPGRPGGGGPGRPGGGGPGPRN